MTKPAAVMRWFRLYSDILENGPLHRLPVALRWRWLEILCLANRGKPRGRLPAMKDVAFALRVSEKKAEEVVARLRSAGLLDEIDERLVPHNWDNRQFASDNVTERVRRFRKQDGNVPKPLHETPPDTDTE